MQQPEEFASQSAIGQQEVPKNTCSTAQEPPLSSPGAVHLQHADELKKSIDRIHLQRKQIDLLREEIKLRDNTVLQLRNECESLNRQQEMKLHDTPPGDLIGALQTYLAEGIAIEIREDYTTLIDDEGMEYGVKLEDFYRAIDAMRFLSERKTA